MDFKAFILVCREEFIAHIKSIPRQDLKERLAKQNIRVSTSTRQDGHLLQVKYGPTCKFSARWMLASRGTTIITDKHDNYVEFIFCFHKFFNVHEFHSMTKESPELFLLRCEQQDFKVMLMLKHDGSNIKIFCDDSGLLHAVTLGAAEPHEMTGIGSPTFSALALRLLHKQHPAVERWLQRHPWDSFIGELISPWNKVVTQYDHAGGHGWITPLAVQKNGSPRIDVMQQLCPGSFTPHGQLLYSRQTSAKSFHKDVLSFVEELKGHQDKIGITPEGVVVALVRDHEMWPCMKFKDDEYLAQHRMFLQPGCLRDFLNVKIAVLEGTWDDMQKVPCQARIDHAEAFTRILDVLIEDFDPVHIRLKRTVGDQKQYALVIKETLPAPLRWMSPALFKDRLVIAAADPGEYLRQILLVSLRTKQPKWSKTAIKI